MRESTTCSFVCSRRQRQRRFISGVGVGTNAGAPPRAVKLVALASAHPHKTVVMDLNIIQVIAIYAIPVILAITLHEAAHGYVAMRFGDMTAYAAGRVSLNPIRHIDPVGTVALPLALLALAKLFGGGGILFGWAKPVPVNFANLRHPKRDMLWVAAAGPVSNLCMALIWAIMVKISIALPESYFALPFALMGAAGVFVNV